MIPIDQVLKSVGHALFPGYVSEPNPSYYYPIIIQYRIPRILLGLITGIALGVSGAVMQGILRNPLVSPFTLGLSSAASFGAAFSIVMGPILLGALFSEGIMIFGNYMSMGSLFMVFCAFIFGLSSIFILFALTRHMNVSQSTLVLSGVVLGYLFQAGISYLKYVSDDASLREIVTWLMGGMWGASWSYVIILIPIVFVGVLLLETYAVDINALAVGSDIAKNLGIDIVKLRHRTLIITALIASACLAFTGIIGFIGLMAPHICRMMIGNDYRYLIPASAILGGIILVSSDAISRIILAPQEVPVGIIMYVIGGLFFIFLVRKMSRGYDG